MLAFAAGLKSACVAQQPVGQVVQSANRFLATLSDGQRAKVVYDFNDNVQREGGRTFPPALCREVASV
jgi:hypothetical protein